MRQNKKFYKYLTLGIVFSLILLPLVVIVDPLKNLDISGVSIPPIPIFFLVVFLAIFGIFSFAFLSKRRGLLAAVFISCVLLLRFFGFTNFIYLIILLLIAILLDFALKRT